MDDLQRLMGQLLLPEEVNKYFTIVGIRIIGGVVEIELEENDEYHTPKEGHLYEKNGFYEPMTIQDFPLRDKCTILKIKRRRWINKTTGKSVGNDYNLIAKGTRYSQEFGAFLKELVGFDAHNGTFVRKTV